MIDLSHYNSGMENGSSKYVMEAGKRDSPFSGQPAKRLKQACLQFKKVGARNCDKSTPQKSGKKRPLSSSEDDVKNTSVSENEEAVQNVRNIKALGICKENQGPSRAKNKPDTLKKNKSNKKQNIELKSANSASANNCDGYVQLVDLSCESSDELVETDTKIAEQLACDDVISKKDALNIDKIKTSQLSAAVSIPVVRNTKCSIDISDNQIEKLSDQRDDVEDVPVTFKKNTNSETIDYVSNCIEAVVLNASDINDKTITDGIIEPIEFSKLSNSAAEISSSATNHIDDCIDSVIKNSEVIEVAQISPKRDVIQQNEPVRKKTLTKVRRSASEELAIEREKQEKLKVQLETAKLRAELKRQREEAKQQREKEKAEAIAKRKKDEIEKLQRLQVKEEERKKREEALQAKSEERLRKAKEKQEKDDEKRKTEEEEQLKKNKVKAAFVSFFVKKDVSQPILEPESVGSFRSVDNVQLAPLHRHCRSNSAELVQRLDLALHAQTCSSLYLEQLNKKEIAPGKSQKLPSSVDKDLEIIEYGDIDELHQKKTCKAKLLQFSENVRPPYWGTWRKRSKIIKSRTPFNKDDKFFDYEVDSEAEWEEEEPGESLSNSEGEKESDDDYEVDNEFFVPHGYLSEEEDQDGAEMSPADFKEQLKLKQKEFEIERKRKCQQLKPTLLGCFWMADNQSGNEEVINVLDAYSAVMLIPAPIETRYSIWLTASAAMPDKTPSPNSSNAEISPPSSQIKSEKSKIQLHFTPVSKKIAVCKKICKSPLIDLTDDEVLSKPLTPGDR